MKCLVTGGAGFIGSHLVDTLVEDNNQVVVFDSFETANLKNINKKADYFHCFVQNDYNFKNLSSFDIVFHLAALPRIQPSFKDPLKTHESNVTGTIKVLELAKKTRTRVVFAGSSSVIHDVYANPYSFSKHIAEEYCTMYNKLFNVSVAIVRFFNVYGPRQVEEGDYATAIGIFEKQKRENRPLTITGDGEQRRDFTHVKDIVSGLVAISKNNWDADVFNLGTGINYSINEIACMFNAPVEYIPQRKGEAKVTLADIDETSKKTGWTPTIGIQDYIESIVNEDRNHN